MSVVAVDGDYVSESALQEVETSSEGPIIQPKENVATAGWFIGNTFFFNQIFRHLFLISKTYQRRCDILRRNDASNRHPPFGADNCMRD